MRLLFLLTLLPALCPAQTPPPKKEAPPVNQDSDPEGLARWRTMGGGMGPLSALFPEVELKVSESFAHDAGMLRSVEEIKVGGEIVSPNDALARLVKLRSGWTRDGDNSEEAALKTAAAWGSAWAAVYNTNWATSDEAPPRVARLLGKGVPALVDPAESGRTSPALTYHPPRASLHELEDGSKVVTYAYFSTYDAGSRGTALAYSVAAYRLTDGSLYRVPYRGREFAADQVKPKDLANFPRPETVTH